MKMLYLSNIKDGHSNNMKILYSAGKPQVQKSTNVRYLSILLYNSNLKFNRKEKLFLNRFVILILKSLKVKYIYYI